MKDTISPPALLRLRSVLVLAAWMCLCLFHGLAHAGRTITSASVDDADRTAVTAGETVQAAVNVTISNNSWVNLYLYTWQSTRWTLSNGTTGCIQHAQHVDNGDYSETFGFPAPTAAGTYDVTFTTYYDSYCSFLASTSYRLSDAVIVGMPGVKSIKRASTNPAATSTTVSWTVTFNTSVAGVDKNDFQLVQSGGVTGAGISSVSGSGTTWTVSANTGNQPGYLGLNLVDDDSIYDASNKKNKLGGSGNGNGNFTGEVYTVASQPCIQPANAPPGLTCVCDDFSRTSLGKFPMPLNADWITSASDGSNVLPSIANKGYLRLTGRSNNNAKAATIPGIFPARGNYISVEFKHYAYYSTTSDHAGDGIAVTLSDYSMPPVPGAYGGSLGYAQKTSIDGFAGGWIGVGLDEYGNYQTKNEGRSDGSTSEIRQSVAIRGSGSGQGTGAGYHLLAGTSSLSTTIDSPKSSSPAPGYSYQVIVDARNYTDNAPQAKIQVNRDTGNGYKSLISEFDAYANKTLNQARVPDNWQVSFTGSTGDSTNIHEIGQVRICAQRVYPPGSGTATGFNAIDDWNSDDYPNYQSGHIFMKVAGIPFKLKVAALTPTQIQTNYAANSNKNVTVKLVNNSDGQCVINNNDENYCSAQCTGKAAVSSQTLTFTSADKGKKLSSDFTINSAYQKLVAIISDGTTTACSTDSFSVRPDRFDPVTTTTPSSGTAVFKAGSAPFSMTATASAGGYTGTPMINNLLVQPLSPATIAGVIDGNFPPATSGSSTSVSTGTAFTYSEVGAFQLAANGVYDEGWTIVDSTNSDCIVGSSSNSKNNGKYGCLIGTNGPTSFGRFIPDHFTLLNGSVVTPACGGTDSFTYMDQPFEEIKFDIEAQNAGNIKTRNYKDELANGTVSVVAENGDAGINLGGRISLPQNIKWNEGTYSLDAKKTVDFGRQTAAAVEKTDAPDGPYDSLQLGVFVFDTDGPKMDASKVNMNAAAAGCGAGCDAQRIGDINTGTEEAPVWTVQPTKVRFGRLKLSNAHGSDRLNLPVPMRTEYWNGTTFVTNTADNCTAITKNNVALLNYKGGINTSNMPSGNLTVGSTFKKGIGNLKLLRPKSAPRSKGSVDVCVDLGADNPEVCKATSANLPWLQGRWSGSGTAYDDDPKSRATFGVFKNANEFIYIREIY